MSLTLRPFAIVLAVAYLPASESHAQNYTITWHTIDGGGATFASGGAYLLGSTIGQPDAGPLLSAGDQSVTGGFWAVTGSLPPPCPADFNHSGAVSVQDIFDFLAAYFGGDPRADFNASGAISVQDIFDFLAAYFTGC